jgi:hypothetical protein
LRLAGRLENAEKSRAASGHQRRFRPQPAQFPYCLRKFLVATENGFLKVVFQGELV